jgi:hypothetical protein
MTRRFTWKLRHAAPIAALLAACLQTEPLAQLPTTDLRKVCQRTLDMPALHEFFHVDTFPQRKPLLVLKNEFTASEPLLAKFGEQVVYVTRAEIDSTRLPYFEFSRVQITGNTAHVEFAYAVERIGGTVDFVREGEAWKIERSHIVER